MICSSSEDVLCCTAFDVECLYSVKSGASFVQ
jgi:hypothetical protein